MNYPPNPNQFIPPDQNPYQNPFQNPWMNQPQKPKEPIGTGIWKVLMIQLPVFLFYDLLMMTGTHSGIGGLLGPLAIFLFPAYWLFLLIMMIITFSTGKTGRGLGYLISLLATLIIGLGSCAAYLG